MSCLVCILLTTAHFKHAVPLLPSETLCGLVMNMIPGQICNFNWQCVCTTVTAVSVCACRSQLDAAQRWQQRKGYLLCCCAVSQDNVRREMLPPRPSCLAKYLQIKLPCLCHSMVHFRFIAVSSWSLFTAAQLLDCCSTAIQHVQSFQFTHLLRTFSSQGSDLYQLVCEQI